MAVRAGRGDPHSWMWWGRRGTVAVSRQRSFEARDRDGKPVAVRWTATGGSIDSNGVYTAGKTPGRYTVTATGIENPELTATVTVIVVELDCLVGSWTLRSQEFLEQLAAFGGGDASLSYRSGEYRMEYRDDGSYTGRRDAWSFGVTSPQGTLVVEISSVDPGTWSADGTTLEVIESGGGDATVSLAIEIDGALRPLPVGGSQEVGTDAFGGSGPYTCTSATFEATFQGVTSTWDRTGWRSDLAPAPESAPESGGAGSTTPLRLGSVIEETAHGILSTLVLVPPRSANGPPRWIGSLGLALALGTVPVACDGGESGIVGAGSSPESGGSTPVSVEVGPDPPVASVALTTIRSGDGASIELPTDLATADTSVAAIVSLDGLPLTGDPGSFAGGVQLEPHGSTFAVPVTVTIPLLARQEPGRELRMYYWDGVASGWTETGSFATVAADGMSAIGHVTHFSYYILQPSAVEAVADGMFGDIEGAVLRLGDDATDADAVVAAFNEVLRAVPPRFPLFVSIPLDVPTPNGYQCFSPVGFYYEFDHQGVDGLPRPLVARQGDFDDEYVEFRVDYYRDVDVERGGAHPLSALGSFAVHVYWRSAPPRLTIGAQPSSVWERDDIGVSADLLCDEQGGLADQEIVFDSDTIGSSDFSPESGDTDQAGHIRTTLSTQDLLPGEHHIDASYQWTSQDGSQNETVRATAVITVGGLTGTWKISGSETWSNCTDPEDNGTWPGTVKFFMVELGDGAVTGGGSWPRTSESFDGRVTKTGTTTFSINGSTDYVEKYENDDGDVYWTISGSSTFEGTGSVATQTIDFTWRGQDQFGDTCSFTGRGRATYVGP